MMRRILVPLDGSELAERAIPYAEALARSAGAKLMFLRASMSAGLTAPGVVEFNLEAPREASDYLAERVERSRRDGIDAGLLVVEDEASHGILEAIETQMADMVVMSTHGRGAVERAIWGSVADDVLRHASVPVFLVPRSAPTAWADVPRPRLVVPLDGSRLGEEALPVAMNLAAVLGAEIVLLQAVQGSPTLIATRRSSRVEELRRPAAEYLEAVADRLRAQNTAAVSTEVAEGRAERVIEQAARDRSAHAIVMATHGRSGMLRVLMGSVAEALLRSAPVPVVLVRPSEAARAEAPESEARRPQRQHLVPMSESEIALTRAALRHLVASSHAGRELVLAHDLLIRLERLQKGPEAQERRRAG